MAWFISILLNCNECQLDIFSNSAKCCVHRLANKGSPYLHVRLGTLAQQGGRHAAAARRGGHHRCAHVHHQRVAVDFEQRPRRIGARRLFARRRVQVVVAQRQTCRDEMRTHAARVISTRIAVSKSSPSAYPCCRPDCRRRRRTSPSPASSA